MSSGPAGKRYKALDKFEVIGELGVGAASRILHIRDPESFQHFAMKVVVRKTADEQKFLDQAKHEFEVAQLLDHPSLIKVHDIRIIKKWWREREVRTLLELVHGDTLENLKSLSVPAVTVIMGEVAGAVEFMHRRNVFHADLKPNNVMVSKSGQVKVIDFGLAWLRGQPKNRVQGTVGFLAPEQVRDRTVNEATEVFNLGATFYKVLTGRNASGAPIAGPGNYVAGTVIMVPACELNESIPRELSDLLVRCCDKKPNKRPASMAAVAEGLAKIMTALKVSIEDLPELLRRRAT